MFNIIVKDGEILLSGRFDASQVEQAQAVFNKVNSSTYVNFKDLDYISSAGLGVLLSTQKRLSQSGNSLILKDMSKLIRDVFRIARFDLIFRIESSE